MIDISERCDVVVVGAGPGGSSCARALHAAGLDVVVIDRSRFPRDKVCAGWITPPVLRALQIDPVDYARGRTWQPITAFRTGLIGGRLVETDYARPVSYGIRRCEFDDYLLLLVGAGGHACPVARRLRGDEPVPVIRAQEAEFPIGSDGADAVAGGVPELYFCDDLAGYGWVIRKGGFINVGLGREDPHDLPGHVQRFCDWLRATGRLSACPAAFKGHAYRLYDTAMPVPLADGILLVGDAAGLAHPQTGEGIRPAIESGLVAAEVIREVAGDYRAERLALYRTRLQARLGRPGSGAVALLPALARRAMGRAILRSPWLTRRVVLDGWFLQGD